MRKWLVTALMLAQLLPCTAVPTMVTIKTTSKSLLNIQQNVTFNTKSFSLVKNT